VRTQFHKMAATANDVHQNVFVTWMEVKTLHSNKILIYKAILKPIWTYGIWLWCTASISTIEILQCFQSKVFRMIVDTPWYVLSTIIQTDLPTLKEEICHYSSQYSVRLSVHPNELVVNLMAQLDNRRL
jgi:hypothetical protein